MLGDLPDNVDLEVYDGRGDYPSDPASLEFWVPPFLAQSRVTTPLKEMTSLKAIQLLSAGAEVWVPAVPAGVTLCDARGVHTGVTAEWTIGAVIASMRGFDVFARKQARHEWKVEWTTTAVGKRALIVGAGDIGEKVGEVLTVLGIEVEKVARRERPGVHPIDAIESLLPDFDMVILILPLTDATRGLVDAKFLSHMKDGALLVNAAGARSSTRTHWWPRSPRAACAAPSTWWTPNRSRGPPALGPRRRAHHPARRRLGRRHPRPRLRPDRRPDPPLPAGEPLENIVTEGY